jgi:hypothetical protein
MKEMKENCPAMSKLVVPILLSLVLTSAAAAEPVLTFSVSQIQHGEYVQVRGTGFTPNSAVMSHLIRPDGKEYPEMPMKVEAQGRVTHEITIVPNTFGTYELLIQDQTTKAVATQRFLMVPIGFDKAVKSQTDRMPATFTGVWDGTLAQPALDTPSRALMTIFGGRIGAVVGFVAYPGQNCGGEVWLVSASNDSVQLGEVILYGQDRCSGRALMTVTRTRGGDLSLRWRDVTGAGAAEGTVRKRSE